MRIAKWEVPSIRNTKPSLLRTAHKLGLCEKDWASYFLILHSQIKTSDLIG